MNGKQSHAHTANGKLLKAWEEVENEMNIMWVYTTSATFPKPKYKKKWHWYVYKSCSIYERIILYMTRENSIYLPSSFHLCFFLLNKIIISNHI